VADPHLGAVGKDVTSKIGEGILAICKVHHLLAERLR
jgi:hypothetical protein